MSAPPTPLNLHFYFTIYNNKNPYIPGHLIMNKVFDIRFVSLVFFLLFVFSLSPHVPYFCVNSLIALSYCASYDSS